MDIENVKLAEFGYSVKLNQLHACDRKEMIFYSFP